ncbi:MAG: rod shape-determining protein MreC [Thiolinea sp.]
MSFRFVVLSLLALTLMAVDYRNPAVTSHVRTAFSIIGYPLQLMVDTPVRAYNVTEGFFGDQLRLSRENAELREQLRLFSVKYRDMQILEQQNDRLRKLLKVDKRPNYTFTMAEILAASDNRGQNVVTLNKGSRDGVFVKQVVVAEGGAIFGQVIEVTPFSAKVMLITDIQHSIPVLNQRTQKSALASGTGKPDLMELKSIVAASDVQDGDIFLSSGLDGLFPDGFPVAMVLPNGVKYVPGDPFANIKARPVINFENTREVLLLWRNTKPDAVEDQPADATSLTTTTPETAQDDTEPAQTEESDP